HATSTAQASVTTVGKGSAASASPASVPTPPAKSSVAPTTTQASVNATSAVSRSLAGLTAAATPSAESDAVRQMRDRVSREGFNVASISLAPSVGDGLHVLTGVKTGSADGYTQRAFFFRGTEYLGTDALNPSAGVGIVWRDSETVALQYQ